MAKCRRRRGWRASRDRAPDGWWRTSWLQPESIRATGQAGFVSASVLAQAGPDLAVVRLRGVRLLRPIVLVWADRTLTETAQAFLHLATEGER